MSIWRELRTKPSPETVTKIEVALAWVLLLGSMVCGPLSQLTIARDEPPFTLGLSWLAIILTAQDYLKNSRIHKESQQESLSEVDLDNIRQLFREMRDEGAA